MILLFSDGLDEDIEKLEQKSDEIRKEGSRHGEGVFINFGVLELNLSS